MATTFPLDKYANNPEVKFITAQAIDGGEWVGRYLSIGEGIPSFDRIMDETPIGEMRRSEFAIFRNRPTIGDNRPRYYWRGAEVKVNISSAVSGLINSRSSDFF
jgi:hypothetical protein